jgi:hypothetical protein
MVPDDHTEQFRSALAAIVFDFYEIPAMFVLSEVAHGSASVSFLGHT